MRGRKPIPTDLHKMRGTHNATKHGRDRAGEPIAEGELLNKPPEWMSDSQQAGWRYAAMHAPRGLLKQIDRAVLAVWVEAEDRHRTAAMKQAMLDRGSKLPLLTKDKNGLPVASPYLAIMNRAAAVLLKAGSEMGFSPAARPRLSAGGKPPVALDPSNPWERLKVIQGGKKASG